MHRSSGISWFSCLPLVAIIGLGCGGDEPRTAPVKGTITMGGKPLAGVGVTFFPTEKGPMATGSTNEQGEFTLMTNRPGDGAVVGGHQVVLGNAEEGRKKAVHIPAKYGQSGTTDLAAEVKAGQTNVFKFDLQP